MGSHARGWTHAVTCRRDPLRFCCTSASSVVRLRPHITEVYLCADSSCIVVMTVLVSVSSELDKADSWTDIASNMPRAIILYMCFGISNVIRYASCISIYRCTWPSTTAIPSHHVNMALNHYKSTSLRTPASVLRIGMQDALATNTGQRLVDFVAMLHAGNVGKCDRPQIRRNPPKIWLKDTTLGFLGYDNASPYVSTATVFTLPVSLSSRSQVRCKWKKRAAFSRHHSPYNAQDFRAYHGTHLWSKPPARIPDFAFHVA